MVACSNARSIFSACKHVVMEHADVAKLVACASETACLATRSSCVSWRSAATSKQVDPIPRVLDV
jgi:hypothetical protein